MFWGRQVAFDERWVYGGSLTAAQRKRKFRGRAMSSRKCSRLCKRQESSCILWRDESQCSALCKDYWGCHSCLAHPTWKDEQEHSGHSGSVFAGQRPTTSVMCYWWESTINISNTFNIFNVTTSSNFHIIPSEKHLHYSCKKYFFLYVSINQVYTLREMLIRC